MIDVTDRPAEKVRTTKSVRWVNVIRKAVGKTPSPAAITRCVPDGTRVYCVGDIHGRDDLLREMAERIDADMETRSFDHAVTVFLGDYVDRGPGLHARGRTTCSVANGQPPLLPWQAITRTF